MPKAPATRNRITRRSNPLKPTPTLKIKTITRVRTSTGRATSKTQKTEQCIQHPTPTPLPSNLPDLPDPIPTEALESDKEEEEEEEEVKAQKGPSRAVSVSFFPIDASWLTCSRVKSGQGT